MTTFVKKIQAESKGRGGKAKGLRVKGKGPSLDLAEFSSLILIRSHQSFHLSPYPYDFSPSVPHLARA